MADSFEILAVVTRSGRTESVHFGAVVVATGAGAILLALGNPDLRTYMRSSAKPFQAISCVQLGAAEHFAWSEADVALVCASHSASMMHRSIAQSILERAGLKESDLECGPHPPLGDQEREDQIRNGRHITRLDNNCSGKHAGMLATCVARQWPTAGYRLEEHPLQKEIRGVMARFSDTPVNLIETGVDGCGVPSFFLSLRSMAVAFARLTSLPDDLSDLKQSAAMICRAMGRHPGLIAGQGRFDTRLGQFAGDRLVVKSGAEGLICAGLVGKNVGIALKTADGHPRSHPAVMIALLRPFLPDLDWNRFAKEVEKPITNTLAEVVGSIEPSFSTAKG